MQPCIAHTSHPPSTGHGTRAIRNGKGHDQGPPPMDPPQPPIIPQTMLFVIDVKPPTTKPIIIGHLMMSLNPPQRH